MLFDRTSSVAAEAKLLYQQRLRDHLQGEQFGRYVAIEPTSGDYFLGDTFDTAVNAALEKHPDRLTHTIRIGHPAAMHLGVP